MKKSTKNLISMIIFFLLTLLFGLLNFIDNEFLRQLVFIPFASIFGLIFVIIFISWIINRREKDGYSKNTGEIEIT